MRLPKRSRNSQKLQPTAKSLDLRAGLEVGVQKMEQYVQMMEQGDTARRRAGDQAVNCVDWSGGNSKSCQSD
jgi:hypothetical protein